MQPSGHAAAQRRRWRMARSNGSSTCRRACRRSRSWSRRATRRCALPQGRGAAAGSGRRCRWSGRRPGCPERRRGGSRRRISCVCRALTSKAICRRAGLDPGRRIRARSQPSCTRGRRPGLRPCASKARCSREGDRITFDAKLVHTAGAVEMRVRGQHDLASAKGRAQIDLPPVDLAPGQTAAGATVAGGWAT